MEMIKEEINLKENIVKKMKQIVIKDDFLIPDIKPDITKVLCVNTFVVINEKEILDGKVIIQGNLLYKITYSSNKAEIPIRCAEFSSDFKEWIDDSKICTDMQIKVCYQVMNTDFKILNERKISLETILNLELKVCKLNSIPICIDTYDEDIENLQKNEKICECIKQKMEIINISKQREIEESRYSIFEILNTDIRIEFENSVEENELQIKGNVFLITTYVSEQEGGFIEKVKNQIPFTMNVEDIEENNNFNIEIMLKNINVNILEDVMGENRVLGYDIDLESYVEVFNYRDIELIKDAYSIMEEVNIEEEEICYLEMNKNIKDNISIDTNVSVPRIEIKNMSIMVSEPCILDTIIEDGKGNIQGVVKVDIIFSSDIIMNEKLEIPFNYSMDLGNNTKEMKVQLFISEYTHNKLSEDEINVKVDMKLVANLIDYTDVKIIKDIQIVEYENNEDENNPSMILYYAIENDNVWSVAKKFKVKKEDLIEQNGLLNEELELNKKLLIIK